MTGGEDIPTWPSLEDEERLLNFVARILRREPTPRDLFLGTIPNEVLSAYEPINALSGGDSLHGFQLTFPADDVRHVLRRHGDPVKEAARGQAAIDAATFRRILAAIVEPDFVSAETANHEPIFVVAKHLDSRRTVVVLVVKRGRRLAFKSARIMVAAGGR